MAYVHRRFKQSSIARLYKDTYEHKYLWPTLLEEPLSSYLTMFSVAKNCPATVSMGCLLPLTAAVCGPEAEVCLEGSEYSIPLNTYAMTVMAPGGGKSTAFENFIEKSQQLIKEECNRSLVIESYSVAGLQRHQKENEGNCMECN